MTDKHFHHVREDQEIAPKGTLDLLMWLFYQYTGLIDSGDAGDFNWHSYPECVQAEKIVLEYEKTITKLSFFKKKFAAWEDGEKLTFSELLILANEAQVEDPGFVLECLKKFKMSKSNG